VHVHHGSHDRALWCCCKRRAQAEDDIRKLRDEIVRLQAESRRCVAQPSQYIPTCEQDLGFQVARLRSEVTRRVALLSEEVQQLKNEEVNLRAELEQCRARESSCDDQRLQALSLQIMRAEDELYRRERNQLRDDQFTIVNCLWRNRSVADIDGVAQLFEVSLDAGCPRLTEEARKRADLQPLVQCLCSEWEEVRRVQRDAAKRADEMSVVARAAGRAQSATRSAAYMKRRKQEKIAEEVSKELAWKMLTQRSDWQQLLQAQRQKLASNMTNLIQAAQLKVDSQFAGQQQQIGVGIDASKVATCTATVDDAAVRANIQGAFAAGSGPNGCALLSLASNEALKKVFSCLCTTASPSAE
jgi:hypothetical protein